MLRLLPCVALQADPPDASKLPQEDIVGVTVLLLTCSYKEKVRLLGRVPVWPFSLLAFPLRQG